MEVSCRSRATTAKKRAKKRGACAQLLFRVLSHDLYSENKTYKLKRSIVVIPKFCYHGNVTSHFSLFPLMKSLVIFSMDCLLFKHSKLYFLLILASVEVLDEVEVEYISLPGWMTSIENCRTFSELPVNAQSYVRKIEEITQIPGQFIIKSMHTR